MESPPLVLVHAMIFQRSKLEGATGFLAVVFLLSLFPLGLRDVFAQSVIRGRVADRETGEPLENANIYISSTTIGTTTGRDGLYTLTGVPSGRLILVGSLVGHSLESIPLHLTTPETLQVDIHLKPLLLQGRELEVVAPAPVEWKRLLGLFSKALIGETKNSEECRIENPEVLDLHMREGTDFLIASTDSVLRVVNQALGYELYMRIRLFEWDVEEDQGRYLLFPRFEELPSHDVTRRADWAERKRETYAGSLRQFLGSLIQGAAENQGFTIHQGKLSNLRAGMMQSTKSARYNLETLPEQSLWRLEFEDWLRIDYRIGGTSTRSFIRLNGGPALIDKYGNLDDPLCLDIAGDWTKSRIADLLPMNSIGGSHE